MRISNEFMTIEFNSLEAFQMEMIVTNLYCSMRCEVNLGYITISSVSCNLLLLNKEVQKRLKHMV